MGFNRFNSSLRGRKRRKNKNMQRPLNRPPVEDLIVNATEHKVLKKFWKSLENRFNVQIRMPNEKSLYSDIIFVSIQGEKSSRDFVKKFLAENMSAPKFIQSEDKGGIDLITLSDDSEDESSSEKFKDISIVDLTSEDISKGDERLRKCYAFACVNTTSVRPPKKIPRIVNQRLKRKRKNTVQSENVSSTPVASGSCEVTSTTDHDGVSKKAKLSESVLVVEEIAASNIPAVDFIPLQCESKSVNQETARTQKNSCLKSEDLDEIKNDDTVILDEPKSARRLRPIVIDGSNIAFDHGKSSHTYSVKGIKLAIDYFLQRGHSSVTAFVPKFRRHAGLRRACPTTDITLFDDLEKKQLVVFTPSRRIDEKFISAYDDRFIVQLAASNGGVIVSNDNFRDLVNESESFREAIHQRLLMFCFAGDVFMVPEDPLGRDGPSLEDFLSFPPDNEGENTST